MDDIMGTKDSIDPSMFLNSGVNFSEPENASQIPSESADTELSIDPYLTGMKSRKRKHAAFNDRTGIMELMKEKFENDKEERAKALKLMEEHREEHALRSEKQDKREEEFLGLFKVITEAFVRMAERE